MLKINIFEVSISYYFLQEETLFEIGLLYDFGL
jgi:hypothetical protein